MSRRAPHDRQLQPRQDHREQKEEPQMKKTTRQVRRRLHTTSRPFQERLLDMAEARREIAAALRIHRSAAMRRSRDQHEQQQQQVQWPPPSVSCDDAFFSNRMCDSPLPCFAPVAVAPAVGGVDHLACCLPARPLGLNLSFQGFAAGSSGYDAKNSDGSFGRPLIQPSPASACSACSSPLAAAMLSHGGSPAVDAPENATSSQAAALPLRPVREGEEWMAADIYSIGEGRAVEWSDVATPAWWSKLPDDQSTEDGVGKLGTPAGQEGGAVGATGAAVGMPSVQWLSDGSGEQGITGSGKPDGVLEMHLDGGGDYYWCHQADSDGEDINLPCMEIGEIEGWDGEWFS